MTRTRKSIGLVCPIDPRHGPLLEIDNRLRCIHQEHDGRPSTHSLGAAPMTRSVFSLDEALRRTPGSPAWDEWDAR